MPHEEERRQILPDYTQIHASDKLTTFELREARGEVLFRLGEIRVLAPYNPDFPLESGKQIQIVDRSIKNSRLGESPLLSEDVTPQQLLAVARIGIAAEEFLRDKTDQAWVNFNFHSRPPMNPSTPDDSQYDSLTLDIHGRDITDEDNWTRPPATHGAWGLPQEDIHEELNRRDIVGEINHNIDESEYKKYQSDPQRVWDEFPPNPSNPADFTNWEYHPSGFYYEEGRRTYTYKEMMQLKHIYDSPSFEKKVHHLQALPLFKEAMVITEFNHSDTFPKNDTDMVLFECSIGERAYQVVTQKTPLVDESQGIHMVVKLHPEPHTPWENPTSSLEALAIGIGLTRIFQKEHLLKDEKGDGEIGDVYFDFNANWSMTKKRELIETLSPEEVAQKLPLIKEAIERDTRAHLHVQFEKMNAHWEIPPAPGTFTTNNPQTEHTIMRIQKILYGENGLEKWIQENFKKESTE